MLVASPGSLGTGSLASGLTDSRQRGLVANTMILGAGVVAVALVFGIPLGVVLSRCDPRRVSLIRFVLAVPLVLPSYVLALAWILLFSAFFGPWVYSLPAAALVLGFSFYPVVMLTTEAILRSISSRLEEAGRLVASPLRVWFRILFPLVGPAWGAALLVVFVLAISDFAVPSMLRVRVYTTEVFTAFASLYDFRLATVMAWPLAVLAALASVASLEFARRPFVGRTEQAQGGVRWSQSHQRIAAALLGAFALSAVALPVGAVALGARFGRASLADGSSISATGNSVWWSMAAASIVVLAGTLLGYWRARASRRFGHLAEILWVVLFAVPGTIAGIGVIGLWNRPGVFGDIYRTDLIVVIAYVARFLPLGAVLCAAFLGRVTSGVEEAAVLSGASWRRTLVRIVLPLSARGLAGVWLVVFILMLGDVSLAILVAPPGESNLPVRAYTLMANSPVGDVARHALIQVGLSVLPLTAMAFLFRRSFESAT